MPVRHCPYDIPNCDCVDEPPASMHKPECTCPSCWPNSYDKTVYLHDPNCTCLDCGGEFEIGGNHVLYGPNFTNPMNQAGQFVSEINRLINHKEAKQMKDQKTHMDTQAIPFFPPPHQPKLSAESQEKYAAGNKAIEKTIRGQILDTAKGLTTGDRNKSYGPPIDNLTTYANLCTAYLFGKGGNAEPLDELDAVDASILMVLAKVSRIAANRGHKDNYVDGAAYMAIAGECDELLGGV